MFFEKWQLVNKRHEFDHDITLNDIREFFSTWYTPEICLFEFGLDAIRLDLIKVDCYKQRIKGYEFKMTKADFKADKKWPRYQKYCHILYFVCPYGLIERSELPKDVGIIYVFKYKGPWSDGWGLTGIYERKARYHEIPTDKYIKVTSLLLNRAKFRKEEIF